MAREPFGTRLRSLREYAGMTQERLAEEVGTDQSQLVRWERNLAEPDVAMIERLAVALGVSAVGFLTGRPAKPST